MEYRQEYNRLLQLPLEGIREEYDELGVYWSEDMDRRQLLNQYPIHVKYTQPSSNIIRLVSGPTINPDRTERTENAFELFGG